jgi:hypothetical protein
MDEGTRGNQAFEERVEASRLALRVLVTLPDSPLDLPADVQARLVEHGRIVAQEALRREREGGHRGRRIAIR